MLCQLWILLFQLAFSPVVYRLSQSVTVLFFVPRILPKTWKFKTKSYLKPAVNGFQYHLFPEAQSEFECAFFILFWENELLQFILFPLRKNKLFFFNKSDNEGSGKTDKRKSFNSFTCIHLYQLLSSSYNNIECVRIFFCSCKTCNKLQFSSWNKKLGDNLFACYLFGSILKHEKKCLLGATDWSMQFKKVTL